MIDEREVFQAAAILLKQHGDIAEAVASQRAAIPLGEGDAEGHATWKRIEAALRDLTRQALESGEGAH